MLLSAWRRLALPLALAFATVACSGGAAEDPQGQLIEAMRALGEGAGVTMTMSIDTDEASLRAISEGSEEPMPPEMQRLLLTSSLRTSMPLGPEAETAEFALTIDGEDVVAVRVVDDVLYVRAQAAQLLSAIGQDPAVLDGARAMLAQTGVLPPEVLEGRWVSLSGAKQMVEQFTGEDVGNPADQLRTREAMERLARVLAENATVTRVGADADGEHLRATAPLRPMYEALMAEAGALGLPMPPSGEFPDTEEVADETLSLDVWVRDGRLSVVSFDLRQFEKLDPSSPVPPGVERFALRMELTPFDGNVEIPADAIELDPEALMGMFMGAMAPAFGESMAGMGTMPPGFAPPPGAMPMPGPPPPMPGPDEQARMADPALVEFYNSPGYGQSRAAYCRQVADMPEHQRRHYQDICPG